MGFKKQFWANPTETPSQAYLGLAVHRLPTADKTDWPRPVSSASFCNPLVHLKLFWPASLIGPSFFTACLNHVWPGAIKPASCCRVNLIRVKNTNDKTNMKSIFKCELYNKLSAEVNLSVVIVTLASAIRAKSSIYTGGRLSIGFGPSVRTSGRHWFSRPSGTL